MGYAMAGLLAGLGKGIENFGKSIEDRRAAALEAARREKSEATALETRKAERAESRTWDVEDREDNQADATARMDKTQTAALAVQGNRQTFEATESKKDRELRVTLEALGTDRAVTLENLRSRNDINTATALESIKEQNKGVTIDRWVQDEGGTYIGLATGRDGRVSTINSGVKGKPEAAAGAGAINPVTGLAYAPGTGPGATPVGGATTALSRFTPEDVTNFKRVQAAVATEYPKMSAEKRKAMVKERYKQFFGKDPG